MTQVKQQDTPCAEQQQKEVKSQTLFDDIRPYNDAEIAPALQRISQDKELAISVANFVSPSLYRWLPKLTIRTIQWTLKRRIKTLKTVDDMQLLVERYLQRCINMTSDGFHVTGVERLDPEQSYLFVSNHRDIVMDPAFCNLALHSHDLGTCRIAIGDNLLTKPFVTELMRINKSFIVKRNVEGMRQKLQELKKLSTYIRHSLSNDHENTWIAQKEGRAKDGLDRTDPALIKMLLLSKNKTESIQEVVSALNIVPVAISYEWDPCDKAKAQELAIRQQTGEYTKTEGEDIVSIAEGIKGKKGRIEISFGEPIVADEQDTPDDIAEKIDQQILSNYALQKSNLAAYEEMLGELPGSLTMTEAESKEAHQQLQKRVQGLDHIEREILLKGYANPVISYLYIKTGGM